MDSIDNCQTLQAIIDAQYAILEKEQTLYASLNDQRLALTAPDISNIADSGEGGSESYAAATLTEQLNASANRLRVLNKELLELFVTKNERFPWIKIGGRRYRWCW